MIQPQYGTSPAHPAGVYLLGLGCVAEGGEFKAPCREGRCRFFSYMTHSRYLFFFFFLNPSAALYRLFLVKFAADLRCCISASLRVAVIGGTLFDRVLEQFNSVSCRLRHSTAARRLL